MSPACFRDVLRERGGIADALRLLPFRHHRRGIDAVGVFPHQGPVAFEMGVQKSRIRPGQIADGEDAQALKLRSAPPAHHEKLRHRQGPHLCFDLFRVQGMDLSGLFKIAGHLRQHLDRGNPYVYRKSKAREDPVPDSSCGFLGRSVEACPGGKIHITLVDGDLFELRGEFFDEKSYHGAAVLPVKPVIRRSHDKARTFAQSGGHRLPGLDTVFLRRDGFGQDYAVAALLISSNDGGNGPQIRRAPVL